MRCALKNAAWQKTNLVSHLYIAHVHECPKSKCERRLCTLPLCAMLDKDTTRFLGVHISLNIWCLNTHKSGSGISFGHSFAPLISKGNPGKMIVNRFRSLFHQWHLDRHLPLLLLNADVQYAPIVESSSQKHTSQLVIEQFSACSSFNRPATTIRGQRPWWHLIETEPNNRLQRVLKILRNCDHFLETLRDHVTGGSRVTAL